MDDMYLFKSQDEGNRRLYAYYKGEFWFYDPNVQQWYISGHVREQYELAAQKEDGLTPDDFTCTGYGYEFVAEYEVPVAVLDALRAAKKVLPPEPASAEMPRQEQYNTHYGTIFAVREYKGHPAIMLRPEHKPDDWSLSSMIEPFTPGAWTAEELQGQLDNWAATKGWQPVEAPASAEPPEIVDEGSGPEDDCLPPNPTDAAPASHADKGAAAADPSCAGPAPSILPTFDFGALDADTAEKLRGITDCVMELYQSYAWGMAYQVGRAHDLLCGDRACETVSQAHKRNNQYSENTFTAWCAYIGVERRSAYNLLNAYRLICKATPEQQKNLQLAPAKLLYETGKKDVPDQLVTAVLDGDITKTKQFLDAKREWQAQLDAERAAREKAEQERDEAATHIQAARDMQIDTARERDTALRRAAEAENRATAAENRAAGAQKLADQRGTENTDLRRKLKEAESRPIDIAVAEPSEADKERWRKEGEDRMAATLQDTVLKAHKAKITAENQVADLQEQLAAARPDADACQRTADTLYETTENLRLLLRTQLKLAQLPPDTYGKVVAHVLQTADALRDTVRSCAPADYTMDDEEEDFL